MNLVDNPPDTLLIGNGYWGNIIRKNLKNTPRIYDIIDQSNDQLMNLLDTSKYVIVATPASSHYELMSLLLEKDCKIFCEKPLTISHQETVKLYEKANSLNKDFFVDWVWLNNPVIQHIKSIIDSNEFGKLYYASMNRLNLGPVRSDVSARFDLTSHDLSILSYFIPSEDLEMTYHESISKNQNVPGTCCAHLEWNSGSAILNSSWNFPKKNRICTFHFEKCTIFWDDFEKKSTQNGRQIPLQESDSPLQISLKNFFNSSYDFAENKRITLKVSQLLNS
jgi:predicted dehydrogenase